VGRGRGPRRRWLPRLPAGSHAPRGSRSWRSAPDASPAARTLEVPTRSLGTSPQPVRANA